MKTQRTPWRASAPSIPTKWSVPAWAADGELWCLLLLGLLLVLSH